MKLKNILAMAALLPLGSLATAQVTVFEDDFESYSVGAADLTSGGWNAATGTLAISTAQNNTGSGSNSLYEVNGDSTQRVTLGFTEQPLATGDTLVVTHYTLGDDSPTTPSIFRSGLTLAAYDSDPWNTGALEELIAFGWYHPNATTNYAARVAFGGANWQDANQAFNLNAWDKLEITLTGTATGSDLDFEVNDSGTPYQDSTTAVPTIGYNGLRLGSFLGFGTANNIDLYYDDVSVVFTAASSVQDWHLH